MTDYVADIVADTDDGVFKITWTCGNTVPGGSHYHVSIELIKERAKGVRQKLQELVDAGRAKKYAEYDKYVGAVATEGFKLYEALFFGDEPQDKRVASRAREWLEL